MKNNQNFQARLKVVKRWLLENKETVERILCATNKAI